ncbi:hypothetical protein C9426_23990 [Serratia sp. S1B]|nr:hypothetical protein C9426_23990 [Serratia sp. S1B]
MANVSRLKKRGGLGAPPALEEAATSLMAPEVAPSPLETTETTESVVSYVRRDGRSARKTNRTLAFATRVTPEFDEEIRNIADREGLKLVEVLEDALEALKEKLSK